MTLHTIHWVKIALEAFSIWVNRDKKDDRGSGAPVRDVQEQFFDEDNQK
ncbi:hypothetical protein [Aeromonas hydrophila]